ncbi:hypothetical protein B0J15DRAFT_560112 [Fusarium solani]|uniref:C2H2-type domain-containing protein n=1 Tax=Fusarium solani TaxID=169388 RepID=A0A9P9H8V0_FUSSL|nr:uncharacterized protein B0J15DRAFT_560112 [Fusarium solani]KAH7253096.1 hypothetical protein B0J15DRAFT_560112 [Fusarium solani]
MAPNDDDTAAAGRPLADDIEGDIMRFSELDFARLGLATELNKYPLGADKQNHFLPLQPSYPDRQPSNTSLLTQNITNLVSPSVPGTLPPTVSQDLSLDFQPLDPALSSTSLVRDPSRSESRGRSGRSTRHSNYVNSYQQPGLPRRRSRYLRQQPQTSTEPIAIPTLNQSTDSGLDPMQRWQDSPPEAEPASLSAIVDALEKTPLRSRSSAGSPGSQHFGSRAASTVSFGSGTSCSSASAASASSVTHRNSSRGRVTKRTRTPAAKGKESGKRVFPCTFCCDSFKSKYDWARHEKSLHLNLQGWRCTPFGGTVVSPSTGRSHCAYCSLLDPTPEHLSSHNHESCQNSDSTHFFNRKDHLVQHLRLVHHVQTMPIIDSWKVEGPPVSSRCGFCSIQLHTWQERVDHLTKHFRAGATMDSWKGEHCFEPSIAAQVTNAIPPYLIAAESRALVPFSSTDPGTKDHLSQIKHATQQSLGQWDDGGAMAMSGSEPSPQSSTQQGSLDGIHESTPSMMYPDVLALHLGRYAQEKMKLGIIPTDRMFQEEARRIMFDSVDPWDQTIADNDDWLSCFRSRHLRDAPGSGENSAS